MRLIFFALFILTPFTVLSANPAHNSQLKVVRGDTVYSILKRYGFNDNQRKAALSGDFLPKDFVLAPGDFYRVLRDQKAARTEIRFFAKKQPVAYTFWRKGSENAGAKNVSLNLETRVVTAGGKVRGSLVESVANVVGDEVLAYRFMDAFILDHNIPRVLRRNAPFSITFEKLYDHGQFVRYGEVLRAELEIGGRRVTRIFKNLKNGGVFFSPEDNYSNRLFYAPVEYIRISSLFQPRRFHPIKKFRKAHEGIDFELEEGSPIYAIDAGEVLRMGRNRFSGNFIVLRHRNGFESYYNHMSTMANLRVGATIPSGTLIGRVGCTGYCTKPHLHFAIKRGGTFINPITLIRNYSHNQRQDIRQLFAKSD